MPTRGRYQPPRVTPLGVGRETGTVPQVPAHVGAAQGRVPPSPTHPTARWISLAGSHPGSGTGSGAWIPSLEWCQAGHKGTSRCRVLPPCGEQPAAGLGAGRAPLPVMPPSRPGPYAETRPGSPAWLCSPTRILKGLPGMWRPLNLTSIECTPFSRGMNRMVDLSVGGAGLREPGPAPHQHPPGPEDTPSLGGSEKPAQPLAGTRPAHPRLRGCEEPA